MLDYTNEIRKRSAFVNLLGISIEKLKEGYCQSRLNVKDSFLNKHKYVHGGVIFLNKHKYVHGGVIYSIADISMGVAVYSTLAKDEETATVEIKINYLKPAITSDLVCDARVIQKGKNIVVLEAEVSSKKNLIAKAQGTFSIFNTKNKI